jgi:hypothetical protein
MMDDIHRQSIHNRAQDVDLDGVPQYTPKKPAYRRPGKFTLHCFEIRVRYWQFAYIVPVADNRIGILIINLLQINEKISEICFHSSHLARLEECRIQAYFHKSPVKARKSP